jgi:hypothetical protein
MKTKEKVDGDFVTKIITWPQGEAKREERI